MNTFVAILLLIIICLTLTIHFQNKIIIQLKEMLKDDPKKKVEKSRKSSVPNIMGISKRQEKTRTDSERQELKPIDSSVTFALQSEKKEQVPPDENDNLDLNSDEFEELDPLELEDPISAEEMDEVNAMFNDAVIINPKSVLHKEVHSLNQFLMDNDSDPKEEDTAFATFTKIEGSDFAKKMLASYAPKSKALLGKWQERIYAQEKEEMTISLSETKEEKTHTSSAEQNKAFDIYDYL